MLSGVRSVVTCLQNISVSGFVIDDILPAYVCTSALGLVIDPKQVRLLPELNDGYAWSALPEREHLFTKQLSKHSIGAYMPVSPPVTAEDDFLNGISAPSKAPPARSIPTSQSAPPITRPKPAVAPNPIPVRPAAPPRNIPPVSALSMKASHTARLQGNVHYKRGDFASAHTSYSSALSHLPKTHPLTLPLLANVALTSIKIGSAKDAVTYANTALELIGPSKGESETVVFTDSPENEPPKPMRDYYGRALMRKAEALEVLEKWSEAALIRKICVEDGHGGATAIQARTRAEKAAQPKPAPVAKKPVVRPPPKPARLAVFAQSSAAVSALRAANAAAEKADDEKFRLSDAVDARIASWRGGREGNPRALLTSLDGVLWEGAGWKKISMADVVLPGKVKVIYMKGIAKVHPDKVSRQKYTCILRVIEWMANVIYRSRQTRRLSSGWLRGRCLVR